MISDFISLNKQESSTPDKLIFNMELPDIFSEEEDVMCTCGEVVVQQETDGFWGIHITLHENFTPLSEGDSYDRSALIESVVINLRMMTTLNYEMSDVFLTDDDGDYKIGLYE